MMPLAFDNNALLGRGDAQLEAARPVALDLNDIVAVADIVTALTEGPLSPFESSRLKCAHRQAHNLFDLAAVLAA